MVNIKLTDGQSGYDVIGEYILKYWEHYTVDDVIVSIETSFDGEKYYSSKEIATPTSVVADIEWLNDWWEGEKFIKLIGIANVNELDIYGGIY